jgi:hypothetical protein
MYSIATVCDPMYNNDLNIECPPQTSRMADLL